MCTTDDKDKEKNTEGFQEGFADVTELQYRFISLKEENKQLIQKKAKINKEMEDARAQERIKLNDLENELYEQ